MNFSNALTCKTHYETLDKSSIDNKILQETKKDPNSKLAIYYNINPTLEKQEANYNIFERTRILITKYRLGSHSLNIETLRWVKPSIPRNERLCQCNEDIQDVKHVILDCHLLNPLRNFNVQNLAEFFKLETETIFTFLKNMELTLNIRYRYK